MRLDRAATEANERPVKRLWACWVGLTSLLVAPAALAQGTLTTILTNGPTANRINLVVLSEGYTNGELAQFLVDATNVVNTLLSTQPYQEYSNYFNAFAISVASVESGSDFPSSNIVRNTYFNSTYDTWGIYYLLSIPPNNWDTNYANGQGRVDSLLSSLMPEYRPGDPAGERHELRGLGEFTHCDHFA